jgi:hypothetical protein
MASMPIADRERAWDADAAIARVRRWAGGPDKEDINWSKYRRAFLAPGKAREFDSYKLPYCDVIDGALTIVPRAVFAAAGGHGVNATDLPGDDKAAIKRKINRLYARMRKEFDDDELESPFAR